MCNIKVVKNLLYGCSNYVNHLLLKKVSWGNDYGHMGIPAVHRPFKGKASSGQIKLWKQSKVGEGTIRWQLLLVCGVPGAHPRATTTSRASLSPGTSLALVQHNFNTVPSVEDQKEKCRLQGQLQRHSTMGRRKSFQSPKNGIKEEFLFRFLKFRFSFQSEQRAGSTLLT